MIQKGNRLVNLFRGRLQKGAKERDLKCPFCFLNDNNINYAFVSVRQFYFIGIIKILLSSAGSINN